MAPQSIKSTQRPLIKPANRIVYRAMFTYACLGSFQSSGRTTRPCRRHFFGGRRRGFVDECATRRPWAKSQSVPCGCIRLLPKGRTGTGWNVQEASGAGCVCGTGAFFRRSVIPVHDRDDGFGRDHSRSFDLAAGLDSLAARCLSRMQFRRPSRHASHVPIGRSLSDESTTRVVALGKHPTKPAGDAPRDSPFRGSPSRIPLDIL
jgi:hypothetical protein